MALEVENRGSRLGGVHPNGLGLSQDGHRLGFVGVVGKDGGGERLELVCQRWVFLIRV